MGDDRMAEFDRAAASVFDSLDAGRIAAGLAAMPDPLDPRSKYRMGLCAAMALALHARTGLPLGLIGGVYDGPEGEMIEFAHAVVRLPDGLIMDVDGPWRMDRMVPIEGCFTEKVREIRLVGASREDVEGAFDQASATPERVAEASAFIDADAGLLTEVEAVVASGRPPPQP